jgi:hypothetical protein
MVNLCRQHPQDRTRVLDGTQISRNEEARLGEESYESC